MLPHVQAAIAGNSDGKRLYRRENQVAQLTLVAAKLLTKNDAYLPVVRKAVLKALSGQIMGSGRRRLLTADAASVQAIVGKRGRGQVALAG